MVDPDVGHEDELVDQWAATVPAIDPRVERVVDRVLLSARYLERLADQLSSPHGVVANDYEILARLFWTGPPHRLRPTQLAAGSRMPLTSLTSRLDRLERRGLITRVPDPRDRRSLAAELTGDGRALFAGIVTEQAAAERDILGALGDAELDSIATALQQVLVRLEERLGPPPRRITLARSTALSDNPSSW